MSYKLIEVLRDVKTTSLLLSIIQLFLAGIEQSYLTTWDGITRHVTRVNHFHAAK